MFTITLYDVPYLISVATTLILIRHAWKQRLRQAVWAFGWFMMAVLGWTLTSQFEMLATRLSTRLFWADLSFVPIAVLPIAWLIMVLEFSGQEHSAIAGSLSPQTASPYLPT